jgi:hypothetical protein
MVQVGSVSIRMPAASERWNNLVIMCVDVLKTWLPINKLLQTEILPTAQFVTVIIGAGGCK